MGRIMNASIAGFLTLGVGACAEKNSPNLAVELKAKTVGVEIVPVLPGELFKHPNAINDPKEVAGKLEIGRQIVASCFYESATLATDSIGLANKGYAFVDDGITNRNDAFNVGVETLRAELPPCTGK